MARCNRNSRYALANPAVISVKSIVADPLAEHDGHQAAMNHRFLRALAKDALLSPEMCNKVLAKYSDDASAIISHTIMAIYQTN
jgi:hypothetical protein